MIGQSPPMRRLFRQLRKVARSDAPVLLRGESGSGKELAASAIHRLSGRSPMPYVAVNCAALPSTLIQAELFGHEKGAFTGADKRRVGRFEAAQGGVVFLDEIGDMPTDQQVNLLRVLEEKRIERLGGNGTVTLNVRVIVATHEDLGEAVTRGTFREDLYYRLNVLSVDIPPLRERGEDIELLANYMLEKFGTECEFHPVKGFNKQALRAMRSYHWPGNVRELINRVQSAVVMSDSSYISSSDLGFKELIETGRKSTLEYSRAESDRLTVEAALRHNRDNMSQAARELGISRTTLYRMMEKLAIRF
jgi:DNA-binding NtrC family response regulator